jgi:hypothetical protein
MHALCESFRTKKAERKHQRPVDENTSGQCRAKTKASNPKTGDLYSTCDVCRARQNRRYKEHSKSIKVKYALHYRANKERINAKRRAEYKADPSKRAKIKAQCKRYDQEHAASLKAKAALRYRANADTINAKARANHAAAKAAEEAQLAQDDLRRMGLTEAEFLAGKTPL